MKRPLAWALGAAALALLLVGGCLGSALSRPAARPAPPPGHRANIIVLSVDSLRKASFRPDRLPTMNALAGSSVVFDNALSTSSWTLPSHASLITGLYPDRHGAIDRRLRLGPEYPTLSLLLWQAGYETVGFTDRGFLDRKFGMGRGYERYDDWRMRPDPALEAVLPRDGDATGTPGSDRFDRAIAFLRQRPDPERPFFLFLHTFGVHDYFYAHHWATERLPPFPDLPVREALDCLSGQRVCTAAQWRRLEELYEAEVAWLDENLELLLRALDETGLRASTYVVLVSDHGEGFDVARQRIHHAGRLHRDLLEIPMLISGPGLEPRHVPWPASLVDVAPTLLELVGVPVPPGLDGVSLAPPLRDQSTPWPRTLFAMEHSLRWKDGRRGEVREPRRAPLGMAAVDDGYWYIRMLKDEELYEMAGDPAQARNLAAGAEGTPVLESFRARVEGRGMAPRLVQRGEDQELLEQLRALGYAR